MADNSRNQRTRPLDRNQESERSRQDNRQNTSVNEFENNDALDRGGDRKDGISTMVPDNYERDSE